MTLFVSLLLITSLLTLVLAYSLLRFSANRELQDASPQHTTLRSQTLLLTVTSLFLVLMTLWLIFWARRTELRMENLSLENRISLKVLQRLETMDSLLGGKLSYNPNSIPTTTSMYVRICGDSVTIAMPNSLVRYGIRRESVPSLISFVEEHGLELNTLSIETDDGIWLTARTMFDFCSLLSRLRPWFIPYTSHYVDTERQATLHGSTIQ